MPLKPFIEFSPTLRLWEPVTYDTEKRVWYAYWFPMSPSSVSPTVPADTKRDPYAMPVETSRTGIAVLAGKFGISGVPLNCRSWRYEKPPVTSSLFVTVEVQVPIQLLFG